MTARPYPRLLADIGGTHARFGWQRSEAASMEQVRSLPVASFAGLESAARAYLAECLHAPPACASIAVATAVIDDEVRLTNHAWTFSIAGLRARLGLQRLCVLNDFTALSLGIPTLGSEDLRHAGGPAAGTTSSAMAVIGPGTGLGVSGLIPIGAQHSGQGGAQAGHRQEAYLPITGEGGHATLAAESADEFAALSALRAMHGHVSGERVLSGQGLVDLHNVLAQLADRAGSDWRVHEPAEVLERWHAGGDALAERCVSMFCAFLGSAAGNLALTLGARGGVYIGGGIVPRLGAALDRTPFRARFEAKGRFRVYLAAIPTWVIVAPTSPALAGAGRALDLGPGVVGRWALADSALAPSSPSSPSSP